MSVIYNTNIEITQIPEILSTERVFSSYDISYKVPFLPYFIFYHFIFSLCYQLQRLCGSAFDSYELLCVVTSCFVTILCCCHFAIRVPILCLFMHRLLIAVIVDDIHICSCFQVRTYTVLYHLSVYNSCYFCWNTAK